MTNSSFADLSPPSSGYPSSGCTSAEPDSVSPDVFNVVPFAIDSTSQEKTR